MAAAIDPNSRVYIHQINKLRGSRTTELYEAMQTECIPVYREHGLELFAYWESAPGQGYWPETVEIWELPSLTHYTRFIAASHSDRGDPRLSKWSEARGQWIEGSQNMFCFPHPKSPSISDLRQSGAKAKLVVHEMVHCEPSRQLDYLEGIFNLWWKPIAEPAGRTLLGLLFSPWNNRRAINIWGAGEEWDSLSVMGAGKGKVYDPNGPDFHTWMTMGLALRDDWDDRFLVPAAFSPLR